jgi:hypothetical protein
LIEESPTNMTKRQIGPRVSSLVLDDFLNVLKNSKEFGVDTPEGRAKKENVIGMFAASTFNPNENVKFQDGSTISLPSYAERLNIQILKASDLNKKLQENGVDKKITVRMICRIARDEKDVRTLMDGVWKTPEKAQEILSEAEQRNQSIYEFERQLEQESVGDSESETKGNETSNIAADNLSAA